MTDAAPTAFATALVRSNVKSDDVWVKLAAPGSQAVKSVSVSAKALCGQAPVTIEATASWKGAYGGQPPTLTLRDY